MIEIFKKITINQKQKKIQSQINRKIQPNNNTLIKKIYIKFNNYNTFYKKFMSNINFITQYIWDPTIKKLVYALIEIIPLQKKIA